MKLLRNLLTGTVLSLAASFPSLAADITGAGATFPAPVYAKWAEAYKAKTGKELNYQAIGSGGGIKQITAKTVDFGASDDPLPGAELTSGGMLQFPAVIGGIVPVVNIAGVAPGKMVLTGDTLAAIYAGQIKKWNDPAIVKTNPTLSLPDQAITVVYRSDSSGTTAVFTGYLAEVSANFKTAVGAGKTANWPAGIGGKGNAGVAANVSKIGGSVGYVEYAFAKQNKLAHAGLVNRDGKIVQPDDLTFAAAAAKADWSTAPGFGISLNNQPGAQSWPITSASFILMHLSPTNPARSAEVLKFFQWALNEGQQLALDLDYVPMPKDVVNQIQNSWKSIKTSSQGLNGSPVLASR